MFLRPQHLFSLLLGANVGLMELAHTFTILPTAVPSTTLRRQSFSSSFSSSPFTLSNSNGDGDDSGGNVLVGTSQLGELLKELDVTDVSEEEIGALFELLDKDGDGRVDFERDFRPWYESVVGEDGSSSFRSFLTDRRTVHNFDETIVVDDAVLKRAVECALAAPNHKMTEPWRFIKIGPETVRRIADLNASAIADEKKAAAKRKRWADVPGWCVVTSRRSSDPNDDDDGVTEREDYAATCCAVQNFMLSMWSEGVGTKWTSGAVTRTKEFADLCGVDSETEYVVACVWYGFAKNNVVPKKVPRKRSVNDVLSVVP